MKLLEDKEQIIEGLEERIDEDREREQDLRRRLTEAEGRAERSEQSLREAKNHINRHEDARAEGKKTVQKPGGVRVRRTRWEFQRPRGGSGTPSRALCHIVAKGGAFEKNVVL